MGSGWWVHVLNVDALNVSRRCCSRMPLFSAVAGTGRGMGPGGGYERTGHPHLRASTVGATSGCCGSEMLDTSSAGVDGNFGGMRPRSAHASLLKKNRVTLGVTYIICLVTASESGNDSSSRMVLE